jgi:acyl-CoA reductase-like NAD-dependent aldehyde dehydrogenase
MGLETWIRDTERQAIGRLRPCDNEEWQEALQIGRILTQSIGGYGQPTYDFSSDQAWKAAVAAFKAAKGVRSEDEKAALVQAVADMLAALRREYGEATREQFQRALAETKAQQATDREQMLPVVNNLRALYDSMPADERAGMATEDEAVRLVVLSFPPD